MTSPDSSEDTDPYSSSDAAHASRSPKDVWQQHRRERQTRIGPAPASDTPPAPAKRRTVISAASSKQVAEAAPNRSEELVSSQPFMAGAAATMPTTPPLLRLWQRYWQRWGGTSLVISLGLHALLLSAATWLVIHQVTTEKQVDFLPGGSSQGAAATAELQHRIQQKKNTWLKRPLPKQKLVAASSTSNITLPEELPDLLSLPQSSGLLSGSSLGGKLGLGGSGGGIGKGMGLGGRDGMVFQPLSMFGREIKARRLALILDVSGSMLPHLPRVVAEVDKVARDSVVVLFYGCGLETPPPRGIKGDAVISTSGVEFEKFWRLGGATLEEARSFRIKRNEAIPNEEIYQLLARRSQTYFIHSVGIGYTWVALLSEQVRQADALYWFSDFQDSVDFKQLEIVRENLQRRKQRLYIHAYERGSAFNLINSELVEPTGGGVIEETE